MAEFFLHKSSPTYLHTENADVMSISHFMAQTLRQPPPPIPPPPKHTFEISEGESVEIEKIVAAEKKDGQLYYKVKWVKYTWEAEESIQHLPHLIDGYWREHFYQNINQAAAIDTTGISLVNNEKNATVVVNAGSISPHKNSSASVITSSGQSVSSLTGGITATATVDDNNDVVLEFTMGGQAPSTKLTPSEKKARRAYPLERKYVCQICTKAFDRNTSLTRHMLVHTREKPFKCQLCDKAFSQNAHLKRHILIHIGQKSYQCNKCGKMFIEKGGLARHEATHSTDKPWVCNQCGKAFVLNEYLQRHLFLHTGQKPYQCNDCGRLFADGSSWRAHKLTHNKEKKFKCPVCSKMLKCKRNFKKHVLSHSNEKEMKHQCDICLEKFPNKKLLKDHWRDAKNTHRCKICRKFLKNREIFVEHMATHNPNSETYDPVIRSPDPNDPDERAIAEEEARAINDREQGILHDQDDSNGLSNIGGEDKDDDDDGDDDDEDEEEEEDDDGDEKEEGEVGGREEGEVVLEKLLDNPQDSNDGSVSQVSSSMSPVSSAFTSLILKPEHVNRMVTENVQNHSMPGQAHLDLSTTTAMSNLNNLNHVSNVLNLSSSTASIPAQLAVPTPTIDVAGTPHDDSQLLSMSRTTSINSGVSHVALQPTLQHSISNVMQQQHQQQLGLQEQHMTTNDQDLNAGTDRTEQSTSDADVAEAISMITQNSDMEITEHQM